VDVYVVDNSTNQEISFITDVSNQSFSISPSLRAHIGHYILKIILIDDNGISSNYTICLKVDPAPSLGPPIFMPPLSSQRIPLGDQGSYKLPNITD